MTELAAVFGAGRDLSVKHQSARAALIFANGLGRVRMSGRRTFGNSSALDIVVSGILCSSPSRVLTGGVHRRIAGLHRPAAVALACR
ncbi:hypothetical protein SAMN05216360_103337 [Methylobacterium phyllostachyos]|uniref:Uncharacterized protein n=1 Tax=Methylobacterium phyllostachyos TaxID=582672 RepID=A0A1G9VZE5_9HYPH|nr:hypothetical protein [Methylobacterium phyllostachyos]SDM77317.1 hypothetical protein SAMN05216360_103337 [Methylobacterium phyllostachyos]